VVSLWELRVVLKMLIFWFMQITNDVQIEPFLNIGKASNVNIENEFTLFHL
jgi:hypothetical protein